MNDPLSSSEARPPVRHRGWKIWENPIFLRYCRSRLRLKGLGVGILVTVLVAGFVYAFCRALGMNRFNLGPEDANRIPIIGLFFFQGLLLFILGTAQASGGMISEKDEGVIDYQRLIPMSPMAKTLGYLFGLPVREYALFAVTLPFTAWAIWKSGVPVQIWGPLYGIFITTAITYHLTGLVTGTIVKNRRWAFLVSIGLIFCLYTVVPQASRFGLVFFKYLTVAPVYHEAFPYLMPEKAGELMHVYRAMMPTVKFFGLSFPEAVFTLFCQGGLALVILIMLCRRWRRNESLLLGKFTAVLFFVWTQILLLGNAIPLIDPGNLFPSRELSRRFRQLDPTPQGEEAVAIAGLYGIATLILLLIVIMIITPSAEAQVRGWRRTRKHGGTSLPFLSDAATSAGWAFLMALVGAAGWYFFTRELVESRWFPGQQVPTSVFWFFALVMVGSGMSFQALLEAKGARALGLAVILIGVAPLMIGSVFTATSDRLIPAASWVFGISPLSGPVYAVGSELGLSELPASLARSIPRAFYFWQGVYFLSALWLLVRLRGARKTIAASAEIDRHPADKPLPGEAEGA